MTCYLVQYGEVMVVDHQCNYIYLLNWKLNHTRTATQSDCFVVLGQHLAVSPKLFNAPDGHALWMTISMVMFGCFLAFMISVSEFLLLSHTSSLTLSISGIFKVNSNSHDYILKRQCLSMFYAPSLERHIPSLGAVWTPICHTSFTFHSELCLISIVIPTNPVWALGVGGVLPIMACTGRLRPKGVPFSGFRYMKG